MAQQSMKVKLREIKEVMGSLSHSQEEVSEAMGDLSDVLLRCVEEGDNGASRNDCFSAGIVKALLGVLRSSAQPLMLADATKCLSLLAYGNDEARIRLAELKAVPILLNLLLPRPQQQQRSNSSSVSALWPEEWLCVYQETLACLRKLTYLNVSNQQQLAVAGGIKLIVELAMDRSLLTNFGHFPPEAKSYLEELVLRKKLIGQVSAVPKEELPTMLHSFSALAVDAAGVLMHYPAFYVNLATPTSDQWISHCLVEKGVAWPDPVPPLEGSKWTCVMVQSVEDARNVWCHFCLKNPSDAIMRMKKSLEELPPPPPVADEAAAAFDPVLGDVCAVFCAAPAVPHLPVPRQQWLRARVLAKTPPEISVLAVDFGFTVTVQASALSPIPSPCRGVPPQAVPCRLRGVRPLPASTSLLENAVAVMRNMAFEMDCFRKEIQNFKGIEFLVKMAETPDRGTVLQALGALLNITVSECMREVVGTKGAVKVAFGFLKGNQFRGDGDLLEYSLGVLLNCGTHCSSGVSLISGLGAQTVLTDFKVKEDSISEKQRQSISELAERLLHFLACYSGKAKPSPKPRENGHSEGSSAKPRENGHSEGSTGQQQTKKQ